MQLPKIKNDSGQPLRGSSGQALLLVLLGMAVVLTLVLSIVARSVTDISVTTKDTEALRAFNAAEAGVEKALVVGSDSNPDLGNQSGYTATISDVGDSTIYTIPTSLNSGESATVWFVSHDANGNLSCNGLPCYLGTQMYVCWGPKQALFGMTNIPAIEVSIYYDTNVSSGALTGNFSNVRVYRAAFDPLNPRTGSNNFTPASVGCAAEVGIYAYSASIQPTSLDHIFNCASAGEGCLLFARIKMLYNQSAFPLAVRVIGDNLPAQGKQIESIGTSGESTVKLNVTKSYSEMPSIFESAIFSMGSAADLVK